MLEAMAKASGFRRPVRRAVMMAEIRPPWPWPSSGARPGSQHSTSNSSGPCSRCWRKLPRMSGSAIDELGEAALEYKFDGARVQVHRSGDDVVVYSRR